MRYAIHAPCNARHWQTCAFVTVAFACPIASQAQRTSTSPTHAFLNKVVCHVVPFGADAPPTDTRWSSAKRTLVRARGDRHPACHATAARADHPRIRIPDYEAQSWYGICAPSATALAALDKLKTDLDNACPMRSSDRPS